MEERLQSGEGAQRWSDTWRKRAARRPQPLTWRRSARAQPAAGRGALGSGEEFTDGIYQTAAPKAVAVNELKARTFL